MQNIARLIGNLFADPNRSIEDLSAGFLAHNTLFQATFDKSGVLHKNQTQTQDLATQLRDCNKAIGTAQAQQQVGRTLTEADQQLALTRLSANLAALNPANDYVIADAKERARLLQLLFPQGMGVFTNASLKVLPDLLRTFIDQVQNPENQVPELITTRTVADLTPFATSRDTQLTQMQTTEQARAQRRALLPQLEEQLTRNLHALCYLYEENRSVVDTYFDASCFEDQATGRPGRHEGKVDAHRTNQVTNLATAPARYTQVRLSVAEDRPLGFYRTDDPKAPFSGELLHVTKGLPRTVPLSSLPGTGALLAVCNDGAFVGHYVAELLAGDA